MTRILSTSILMLIAVAFTSTAIAAPTAQLYPEVVPGPGLPSLAELNVTSAQLHTMGMKDILSSRDSNPALVPRFDLNCDGQFCSAGDAVACINYIAAIGGRPCYTNFDSAHRGVICRTGSARFQIHQLVQGAMSSCHDVARGGGYIMDRCTQHGLVTGNAPVYGNGNLIADLGFINSP